MRRLCLCLTMLILSLSALSQQEADERRARDYSAGGDFDKALELYQKLYNEGANPEYYDQYISLLLQTKRFAEAKELTAELMAGDPTSPVYPVDLGRIYQQEGFMEKTDSLYKSLFRKLPADEFRIRELAAAFYRANAYDYAVTTFTHGRKLLGNEQAFAFDLLALYRYKKDRRMLISEYIHVLSFNPDETILHQAKNSFATLFESDEHYALLEEALQKGIKKRAPQPELTKLLSWAYLQQEKYVEALNLLINLDKKTGSGTDLIFSTGAAILEKQALKEALPAFEYIATKGTSDPLYIAAKARILYCKTEILSLDKSDVADIDKLTQEYRAFLNTTHDVGIKAFLLSKLAAFHAYDLGRHAEAAELLQEALTLPGIGPEMKNNIKLELADVSILIDDVWEATLIYSQVERDAEQVAVKQEARFRNARLSYFRGDFVWAQAQLSDLKAATDQMLANDALNLSLLISGHTQNKPDTLSLRAYARADMMLFSKRYERAFAILDSVESAGIAGSLADDMLMLRARIHLGMADYSRASEVLEQIVESNTPGIWADDALFLLGDTYEKLKKPSQARDCYEKIIKNYPGSLYISEARIRFRKLRGDSLG